MLKAKFQQLICGSTEKSITMGYSGFGVRTKSPGLTDNEAEAIFRESGTQYAVSMDRCVSREDIIAGPRLDLRYPPMFMFKKIGNNEVGTKYIVARSLYVGIDYGYFCNEEHAQRAGSNYLAHIMVFDSKPSIQTVAAIVAGNNFLPANTIVSPDNAEMVGLLCGEPTPLPDGELTLEEVAMPTTPETAQFAIAMLQAYANKCAAKGRTEVIVKSSQALTPQLMQVLASLPPVITDQLYFMANAQQLTNVPDNMGLLILSDTDDVDFDRGYYVTVDFSQPTPVSTNIDDNILFDEIRAAAEAGDSVTMQSLIDLFADMALRNDTDYVNAIKLRKLAKTPVSLPIDQLTPDFVTWIIRQPVNPEDEATIWTKINSTLNDYCSPDNFEVKGSMIRLYIDDIYQISKNAPEHLDISMQSADFILKSVFNCDDKGAYLGRILQHDPVRLDGLLTILRRSSLKLPDINTFFEALATIPYPEIWDRFIRFYYNDNLDSNMFEIVRHVAASNLASRHSLCTQIFPFDKYLDRWINIFSQNPELLEPYREDINDRFFGMMRTKPVATMEQLLSLPTEMTRLLDIDRIVNIYLDTLIDNQSNLKRDELIVIANTLGEMLHTETTIRIANICIILGHDSLPKEIDYSLMRLAMNISSDDRGYVKRMYREWIKTNPSAGDVARFLSDFCMKVGDASDALESLWEAISDPETRRKYILYVADNARWKSFKTEEVLRDIRIEDLRTTIENENSFGSKIMRKFKSLFTKTPGGSAKTLLLLIAIGAALALASCDSSVDKVAYHNPFRVDEYGFPMGTDSVEITNYSGRNFDKASEGNRYFFAPNGDLVRDVSKQDNGTFLDIEFKFSPEGKMEAIYYDGQQRDVTITYDEDNCLTQIRYNDVEAPTNGWNIVDITYDNEFNPTSLDYYSDETLIYTKSFDRFGDHLDSFKIVHPDGNGYICYLGADCYLSSYALLSNYDIISRGKISNDVLDIYVQEEGDEILLEQSMNDVSGSTIERRKLWVTKYPAQWYNDDGRLIASNLNFTKDDIVERSEDLVISKAGFGGFDNLKKRFKQFNRTHSGPGPWLYFFLSILSIIALVMYMTLLKKKNWWRNFRGEPDPKTGMRRMWMFNWQPFYDVTLFNGAWVASFLTAVLALLALGGVVFGLLWLLKLIVWIIIIIGYGALIIGGIMLFAKEGSGCLPVIIGGAIVMWKDGLSNFGDRCVKAGFSFFNSVNIFDWTFGLFANFWDALLMIFIAPLVIFAAIAAVIIVLVYLLTGIEKLIMLFYGISRPCPSCGRKKTPIYYADAHTKHPVTLQPGVYGVLHQVNPQTGQKLPTMLLNGKGNVIRQCACCNKFINVGDSIGFGTEKHLGIVGFRGTGKSYLLYSMLSCVMDDFHDKARQIDVEKGANSTDISQNAARIEKNAGIQTSVANQYRAVQILLDRKFSKVPYHLFCYDVAGEMFNHASRAHESAMKFYTNVESIVFVIDPAMISTSGKTPSERFMKWAERFKGEKHSPEDTLAKLRTVLEENNRRPKNIDVTFVFVKADTGYLEACGMNANANPKNLEAFLRDDLDMANLVNSTRGAFKSLSFAVASIDPAYRDKLRSLYTSLFHQLGIN